MKTKLVIRIFFIFAVESKPEADSLLELKLSNDLKVIFLFAWYKLKPTLTTYFWDIRDLFAKLHILTNICKYSFICDNIVL